MALHPSTFENLKPTDQQLKDMEDMRHIARAYADKIDVYVPEGPDKTFIHRKLREVAMWVNVGITRNADGSPRG